MREITIRQATLQDLDQLTAWRMETIAAVFSDDFAALPASDRLALEEANRGYYRQAIPAGQHIAVFAQADGETAGCGGMCLQQEMPSPDNPAGRCAYLMNIYTRPSHRGKGVANAVVSYLVAEAQERGIAKIYLETTDAARRLYEGLGFVDMVDYMKLEHAGTDCKTSAH